MPGPGDTGGAARPERSARSERSGGPADLRLVPPALAAWIAAAVSLTAPVRWAVSGALLCLAAAAVLLVRGARRPSRPVRRGRDGRSSGAVTAAALLCAGAAAASAVLASADLHRGPLPALAARQERATVEVTLTGDPRQTRPRVRGSATAPIAVLARGTAERVTAHGTVTSVRAPVLLVADPGGPAGPWLRLLPSTRLTIAARLLPPARPDDRVAAVLYAHGPPVVSGPPSALQRTAGALRAGLRTAAEPLAPDARALLPGLVDGDTSQVGPELQEAFASADLTHLLAVSGSNLAIILALLIGPPAAATRAERRGLAARFGLPLRATALTGGLLTIGFVVLCRPDPSVLRAAACGLLTLLAIGTGRRRTLLPALAAAVTALLLYDPWLARSYGFLLSVLATTALLTLAPRWADALRRRRIPGPAAEALAAAAAAQVLCAPVIAVLAAHVSLVAIPCNLLAELAVPPATVLGFAALAAAPLSPLLARALAWLAGWPAGWIAAVARAGGGLPGAALYWPGGWTGGLLLAAVTVPAVLFARRLVRHPWLCAGLVLLLLVAVLRPAPLTRFTTGWPPPGWRLAVCDVGQGDALALRLGDGSAVVIDTGPEPDLVDHCLRALDVRVIPLLVLTHFHADHVAGLPGVLAGRSVGAIETTSLDAPAEEASAVRRRAAAAHIPLIRAAAGEHRRLGDVDWQVLWPPPPPDGLPDDGPNDASVTLLVRTAGLTFLLLGDLEPPAQRDLLARRPDLAPVDVLKVAHHGSSYQDPELLRRVRPRLALVSVGRDNPYGHPAARTIGALRAEGATVLRTDTDGSIAVTAGERGALGAALAGRR